MLSYYLLVGVIIGGIVTLYESFTAPQDKRRRTLIELGIVTLVGTALVKLNLPVNLPSALALAAIFAVVNQIPQWFFDSGIGLAISELIGIIPPAIIFAFLMAGFAWLGAIVGGAALFTPAAIPAEAMGNLTVAYTVISLVTVGIGMLAADIRV